MNDVEINIKVEALKELFKSYRAGEISRRAYYDELNSFIRAVRNLKASSFELGFVGVRKDKINNEI